jgi:UDP-glucose 6-dehydrogenase
MRLKAVTKDLNEIKGQYSELDIQKSLLRESGKSQNPENAEKIIEKITDKMEGMKGSRK